MKRLLLVLLAVTFPLLAIAQDFSTVVRQAADKCVKAMVAADYESFAPCTHPRVVEGMGGKDALIAALKRSMAEMCAQGIAFQSATVGEPEKSRKIGEWFVAFVPQHIVLKVPQGHVEQDGSLLGISEDNGKKWVFVDVGPVTKEQFASVFPELAGKLDLPEKKQPVFKKE